MVKNTPTAMPTRTSIIVVSGLFDLRIEYLLKLYYCNLDQDALVVEALQSVFNALHDPSLLDAGRHQRYDLYTTYIPPETPEPVSISHPSNIYK